MKAPAFGTLQDLALPAQRLRWALVFGIGSFPKSYEACWTSVEPTGTLDKNL